MKKDNTSTLKSLGSKGTEYVYNEPSHKILETFENKFPNRPYHINLDFREFTSLCPKTGQPDFAEIFIEYIPHKKCVETKSLKLYLFAYRQMGTFMETIANNILEDLVKVTNPIEMTVVADFKARGGIRNVVTVKYVKMKSGKVVNKKPFTVSTSGK
jgi:7-cyano-7-deazaguanine reductase